MLFPPVMLGIITKVRMESNLSGVSEGNVSCFPCATNEAVVVNDRVVVAVAPGWQQVLKVFQRLQVPCREMAVPVVGPEDYSGDLGRY